MLAGLPGVALRIEGSGRQAAAHPSVYTGGVSDAPPLPATAGHDKEGKIAAIRPAMARRTPVLAAACTGTIRRNNIFLELNPHAAGAASRQGTTHPKRDSQMTIDAA
ncbi:hypothetical protein ACFOGJ_14525 [Marinibaculum pumilum]|uniref:Uncharacterized protein n=1 Tax=Marinibaculum pumilum TaxID=1766165 RepID=A0ABV7L272_9PROT